MQPDKFLVVSGLMGFIIFLAIAIPLGFFFPGYDHVNDVISKQGAVDSPIMVQANILFFLFGLFLFLFGIGLWRVYARNLAGKLGSALITISGLSVAAVGFLPCDPGCVDVSIIGELHQVAAEAPLIIAAIALIFITVQEFQVGGLGSAGKNNPWVYIVMAHLVISVLFGFLHLEFEHIFLNEGLIQRIAIGIPVSLVAVVSIHLYRKKFST